MVYKLVGLSTFNSRAGNACTALHMVEKSPIRNGQGFAVVTKVTTIPISGLSIGKDIDVTYSDRGFIVDVKQVS